MNLQPLNLLGNAPLVNVGLCVATLEKAINRPSHLPGIVSFSGPSGYGKSTAAAITANRFEAVYVEAKSSWSRKATYLAILKEMGIVPAKTIYGMAEQVAEQLALSRKPLIVDEFDYLLKNGTVEIIRDIYEASRAAIMIIGEENLPTRLRQWERFHGRVMNFAQAQPPSLADARALCDLYVDGVDIADDLLAKVHKEAKGSVRRICVNLEYIREEAADNGLARADMAFWGDKALFTGDAPARRV